MSAELAVDGVILAGAILGATIITLVPFFKKFRESQQLDGTTLKFDKKFLYTALIAFTIGAVLALLNFDDVRNQINPQDSLIKIFATSFGIAFAANWIFNSVLKPDSLVGVVSVLQQENQKLKTKLVSLGVKNLNDQTQ